MDNIKKTSRNFLFTLIAFILSIVIASLLAYLSVTRWFNEATGIAISFGILLVMLFVTSMFKTRIDRLTNLSYSMRIRKQPGNPMKLNRLYNKEALNSYLTKNDYILFSDDEAHMFYYRLKKDTLKQVFQGYIFEVIVYIKPDQEDYYLDIVDEEIQKLYRGFADEKKRVDKMLITQMKQVDDLTEDEKNKLSEIVFIRTRQGIISTINVGLMPDHEKAVLLYSDLYTPSIYYSYHIDQIRKMV